MKDYQFLCGCGCRVKKDEIKRLTWRDKHGTQRSRQACPGHLHAGYTKNRVTLCSKDGCDKEILFTTRGGKTPNFCKKHKKEHEKKRKRDYSRKYMKEKYKPKRKAAKFRNGALRDNSRWDCLIREKCLPKYLKYQTIPCKSCEKYNAQLCGAAV